MTRKLLATALLLLGTGTPVLAQTRTNLNEASLSANLRGVSAGGESSTIMQVEARYGRFLSPRLELGGSLSATKYEGIDMYGTLGAFGAWHFGLEGATAVPYVGASAGFGFGGGDDNPVNVGVFAGYKLFLGESVAVVPEAFVNRIDSGGGSGTEYGVRAGLAIFW